MYILLEIFPREFGNALIFSTDCPRCTNDLLSGEDGGNVRVARGRQVCIEWLLNYYFLVFLPEGRADTYRL
jgi:hypothetical protein